METELTIQQVAEKTGLSVHTLRYYERNGLLEPVHRATNGHRRYAAADITRIEFLTRLRSTGMPIRQMQEFTQLFRERPEAIADRRAILEEHQRNVEQHIQELQQNLVAIQKKICFYQELEQANADSSDLTNSADPTMMSADDQMLCVTKSQPCPEVAAAKQVKPESRQHQPSRAGVSISAR